MNTVMEKKLERSNDRMLAGVCAGFAEYLGLDVTGTRIAYAALTIFTSFAGVIFYIIAMIIMPEKTIKTIE